MDQLGGYPQLSSMQYNNKPSTNEDFLNKDISESSWFGLAISGIKFLLNQDNSGKFQQPSSNSVSSQQSYNKKNSKLHILGPGVFKKQLSDIPENPIRDHNRTKKKKKKKKFQSDERIADNALTKQALQRFNHNFNHYWHQRSSLHSHNSDDQSIAGSTQNATTTKSVDNKTDGASSTVPLNEYAPSMTSSQILHPSQDVLDVAASNHKMTHSKSYPLLHSAEHIKDLENEFRKDTKSDAFNANLNVNVNVEGIIDRPFPSPPPLPTTPRLQFVDVVSSSPQQAFKFADLQSFTAVKSWETVQSIPLSIQSIHSDDLVDLDDDDNDDLDRDAISKCMMQGPSSSTRTLSNLLNDNHFTCSVPHPQQMQQITKFEKEKKLWLQKKKKSRHCSDSTHSSNSYDIVTIEKDWADDGKFKSETIAIVSRPLPKSTKRNSKKSKNRKKKSNDHDEECVFSDWSNISSNIGPTN